MGYFILSNDKEKTATVEAAASKLLGMNVRVVFVQTNNLKKRDGKPNLEDF
jgi:hypothetical protein